MSNDSGAIPFETVENGIHAWVMAGAELDAEHVKWAIQAKSFPDGRYVSLRLTAEDPVGTDWKLYERTPMGVVVKVQGPRVFTLQIRCYNGDALGRYSNIATISRIVSCVQLPSVRRIIEKGRFGVGSVLTKTSVLEFTEVKILQPYAVKEIAINVASEVSEPAQLIERVGIGLAIDGGKPEQLWVPHEPPPQPFVQLDDAWLEGSGKVS